MPEHPEIEAQKKYWIAFNLINGVGSVRFRRLLDVFGDLRSAWRASSFQLRQAGLHHKLVEEIVRRRRQVDLDRLISDLARQEIRVLTWDDPDYPARLRPIDQSPPVLYLRGAFQPEDRWAVAIVGTRRATPYGKQVAAELADFLARQGVTIVSGFARGVDTIAHREALSAGGRTIAVLGSGVDRIYPPENRHLVREMLSTAKGVVLSDYPPGTPPEAQNFPPRNRIISGLSLAVVIVEAGERSGASITAQFALDQGREVMAVPGNITAPQSVGSNRLIRNGAHPCLQPQDVLDVLDWVSVVQYPERNRPLPDEGIEQKLFAHLQQAPGSMDEVCRALGLPAAQVAAALSMMEIKGLVRQQAGRYFAARLF